MSTNKQLMRAHVTTPRQKVLNVLAETVYDRGNYETDAERVKEANAAVVTFLHELGHTHVAELFERAVK